MVATPLGHREDVTLRALRVLSEVALVACEDTRRTARLLRPLGIRTPTTSYFEHNQRFKGARILEVLRGGRDVALVSDAGTPGISDPGHRLVRDARAEGIPVLPVPGPSAVVTALSVSGFPGDRFRFVGFLPRRPHPRQQALEELAQGRETLVVFEAPTRVLGCLLQMEEVLGDREAFLCREATKLHEEYVRGRLSELRRRIETHGPPRGEFVLVVSGAEGHEVRETETPEVVFRRLVGQGRSRREAVKETARLLGLKARDVYQRVLEDTPRGS